MLKKNDGKIHTRCQTCGKRVKFPAGTAGEAYRCPICHTTMVAPLDGNDIEMPDQAELLAVAAHLTPPQERPHHKTGKGPKEHPVKRFGRFLNDETIHLARTSCRILADPELSTEDKLAQLNALRKIRTSRLREQATSITADLELQIQSLKHCPSSDTLSNKRRVAALKSQLREMTTYLEVMFNVTLEEHEAESGNRPSASQKTRNQNWTSWPEETHPNA